MHTKHNGLEHTYTVPLVGDHYVRVFIWDSVETLRKHQGEGDAEAFASGSDYVVDTKTDQVRIPKKFGEVHFYKDGMGAGIVAHELTHILVYWILANRLELSTQDEEICRRMENMTRAFWSKFYEWNDG